MDLKIMSSVDPLLVPFRTPPRSPPQPPRTRHSLGFSPLRLSSFPIRPFVPLFVFFSIVCCMEYIELIDVFCVVLVCILFGIVTGIVFNKISFSRVCGQDRCQCGSERGNDVMKRI